jgi:glycosyltransferase involved in cell wall biosynthesis
MENNSRRIVILNQATNYLTIGFANAFAEEFEEVFLVTGSIHTQGEELSEKVKVIKIATWKESPIHKKAISYLLALIQMWFLSITKFRNCELFFVSIPPMGYLLNLILPNRFSIVVWDVYPDTFKITGMTENHLFYRFWSFLNRISFKKAYKLFTISEKMADLLEIYVKKDKIIIQPIWSIFQEKQNILKTENPFIQQHKLENKFIVQYSGNIGLTHNVEVLIEIAEYLKSENEIVFQIIGRGPRKSILENEVRKRNLPNCMFLPFQSDEMFPFSLSASDLGVVILDEATSKGSVPSKSYNLMSCGIPSLYIVSEDSQLNLYACKYNNARSFTKNQIEDIADFILKLKSNAEFQKRLSENALTAAKDFTRDNADSFVKKYIS